MLLLWFIFAIEDVSQGPSKKPLWDDNGARKVDKNSKEEDGQSESVMQSVLRFDVFNGGLRHLCFRWDCL